MDLRTLAPATATVPCSGETHRLIWRSGELELPDHTDPGAERALSALGGNSCRCVQLLDAWTRARADPRALVIGPRGPRITVVAVGDDGNGASSAMIFSRTGGGPAPPEPKVGLEELLALPGGLPRRLLASVASTLIERGPAEPSPLLHAALYGRVLPALGRWLGELPDLDLDIVAPGTPPTLAVEGSRVSAALATEWLVSVWGAGLEIVVDRFILAATPEPDGSWRLDGVDQLLAPVTLRLAGP